MVSLQSLPPSGQMAAPFVYAVDAVVIEVVALLRHFGVLYKGEVVAVSADHGCVFTRRTANASDVQRVAVRIVVAVPVEVRAPHRVIFVHGAVAVVVVVVADLGCPGVHILVVVVAVPWEGRQIDPGRLAQTSIVAGDAVLIIVSVSVIQFASSGPGFVDVAVAVVIVVVAALPCAWVHVDVGVVAITIFQR